MFNVSIICASCRRASRILRLMAAGDAAVSIDLDNLSSALRLTMLSESRVTGSNIELTAVLCIAL